VQPRTALPLVLFLVALLPTRVEGGPLPLGRPAFAGFRLPWGRLTSGLQPADWQANAALEHEQGRRVLEFAPDEPACALFLEVVGSVEFERIDYALEDGRPRSAEVFGLVRGRGLYQVVDLDGAHRVSWVRIIARARSPRAGLGLRLGLR
jgi:hypothetical protein